MIATAFLFFIQLLLLLLCCTSCTSTIHLPESGILPTKTHNQEQDDIEFAGLLNLAHNSVHGRIPSALANCRNLHVLTLVGNRFSGDIPPLLRNLLLQKQRLEAHDRCLRLQALDASADGLAAQDFPQGSISSADSRSGSAEHRGPSAMAEQPIITSAEYKGSRRLIANRHNNRRAMVEEPISSANVANSSKSSSETFTYADDARDRGGGAPIIRPANSIKIALIASGCAIMVVLLILVLAFVCLKHEMRRGYERRRIFHTRRGELYMFEKNLGEELTYDSVVKATKCFSLDNLIGSGGFGATYKAELRPGVVVAVKKIYLGRFTQGSGGSQQFEAEIRTLGSIRHPNLVKLLGYYSDKSEMFLLYNYLPGGNLEGLIHGGGGASGSGGVCTVPKSNSGMVPDSNSGMVPDSDSGGRTAPNSGMVPDSDSGGRTAPNSGMVFSFPDSDSGGRTAPNSGMVCSFPDSDSGVLSVYGAAPNSDSGPCSAVPNWSIRFKIALDIATALAYLHDECFPRILHRDIKPSNVLLDHNLNAFLSDFGLARLLSASETHVTTDVLGTLGYVAPEYVLQNRVSDKADVYSYGVLLLELISGKKVMDRSFAGYGPGFDIVVWARQLYNSGCSDSIFASGLWAEGPASQLMAALKLALKCTVTSRAARPTMKQAVDILREAEQYQYLT